MNIFLIGFMGAGKTYLGKKLAEDLSKIFIDLDGEFKKKYGDISTVFKEKGEVGFRILEAALLKELNFSDAVIACGGGTPCYFDNLEFMKERGAVVFVNTPLSTILKRISDPEAPEIRPMLRGKDKSDISELYTHRLQTYRSADIVWDPEGDWEEFLVRVKKLQR